MLYREAGQFKTSYEADEAVFPILQDRISIALILVIGFAVVPLVSSNFTVNSVLIPVLVLSLAAVRLSLLPGCYRLAVARTGGFMGVGCIRLYKLTTFFGRQHHHSDFTLWLRICCSQRSVWLCLRCASRVSISP
jgi:branched-chain amino acid transport system permease protein